MLIAPICQKYPDTFAGEGRKAGNELAKKLFSLDPIQFWVTMEYSSRHRVKNLGKPLFSQYMDTLPFHTFFFLLECKHEDRHGAYPMEPMTKTKVNMMQKIWQWDPQARNAGAERQKSGSLLAS